MKTLLVQTCKKLLINLTSRKFLAFVVATWLVSQGLLSSYAYAMIALAFIGVQGYLDHRQMPMPGQQEPYVPLNQPFTGSYPTQPPY